MRNEPPHLRRGGVVRWMADEWLTLFFTLAGIAFAAGATTFHGKAVPFPLTVGILTALLGATELSLSLGRAWTGGAARVREPTADNPKRDALVWFWMLVSIVLIYALGLLGAAAVSAFIYSLIILKSGFLRSVVAGAGLSVMLWLIFERLAGFQLYSGMFL